MGGIGVRRVGAGPLCDDLPASKSDKEVNRR